MLDRIEHIFERALRLLAYVGGAVLVGLMLLVVYEVFMRYFYGRPFRGGYEMTELAMALIVAFALPYTAITKGHVAIDVLGRWLDLPAMRWLNALVHFAGAVLLALVAWRASLYALRSYEWGDLSNMMRIPKYPFQFAISFSALLFSLVLVLQGLTALRGTPKADEDGPEAGQAAS